MIQNDRGDSQILLQINNLNLHTRSEIVTNSREDLFFRRRNHGNGVRCSKKNMFTFIRKVQNVAEIRESEMMGTPTTKECGLFS